jgi:hypothetical protein
LVQLLRLDLEGEVKMARVGLGGIARLHLKQVEAEVPDGDECVLRPFRRLVFFVLSAAAAYLSVENFLVKFHRTIQIGDDKCKMIHSLQLHTIVLLNLRTIEL